MRLVSNAPVQRCHARITNCVLRAGWAGYLPTAWVGLVSLPACAGVGGWNRCNKRGPNPGAEAAATGPCNWWAPVGLTSGALGASPRCPNLSVGGVVERGLATYELRGTVGC